MCGHPKAMDRATRGTSRADKKLSPYGLQLLEKQRLRAYYGVLERQFSNYVKKAMKSQGETGTVLVQLLECRLDNLVYRLGLASSIRQARQMVVHGHILVNGNKVDRPSYGVSVGEKISLREKSKKNSMFIDSFQQNANSQYSYLSKDLDDVSGTLTKTPERNEVPIEINDILVVEYYSKLK